MRFSTIFTVLAAGAMAFAGAIPEVVEKRATSDVVNAFNTLNNQCNTFIPQLGACTTNDCTSAVIVQLVAAINVCTTTLGSCTGGDSTTELAEVVIGVVTTIANGLYNHLGCTGCSNLLSIYAQVNVALAACLTAAINLCAGLLLSLTLGLVGLVEILLSIGLTTVLSICLL